MAFHGSTILNFPDRSRSRAGEVRPRSAPSGQSALVDYCGAVHVHSTYSDGDGTIPEILDAARGAGLDYVLLTDHAEMSLCDRRWEAWHDGVLLALGCELSPGKEPHSLALELDDPSGLDALAPAERLAEVNARGGYSFIAHPRGHRMAGMDIPPWTEWKSPFIAGLEIWSFTYDWLGTFRWRRAVSCYRRPHALVTGPNPEVLATWDRLASRRPVSGIAGVDAHARPTIFGRLKIFPYDMLFGTTLTHVLVGELGRDAAADAATVKKALVAGRCYMAYHAVGDPAGFRFFARSDSGIAQMGDEVALTARPALRVTLPATAEIRFIANGRAVAGRHASRAEYRPVEPGPHRVEVRHAGRPWIFSNHVHVTS